MIRDDAAIEKMILEKFIGEGRLDIKRIGAESKEGVVILRGQASSLGEIELAQELAAQVKGVEEVRTLLKFTDKAKGLDDSVITKGVELALGLAGIVNSEDIVVNCSQGIITLEGMVDKYEEKEIAEILAKTVPGVIKVIDRLDVRYDNEQSDGFLTTKLRRALHEDSRLNSTPIKAYVSKKTAYMSGKVYGIDAKKAAEEVAQKTAGIKEIVNDIIVAYH